MKKIFDKTILRGIELKNRIWRSATWMALANADGTVSDGLIESYEQLARGGVGMIVTGLTSVTERDASIGGECKFYDDRFIAGHRLLTDAVHRHGSKILMQTAMVDGPVNELDTEQVMQVVAQFGDAARRAEQAGYDGVQIHAAHFFYLSKFISPLINNRNDRYGGDQRGRAQILVDILSDMRAKTSRGFCITMKINSSDEYPGGLTVKDFLFTCQLMAEAGIDAVEVSGNGTSRTGISPMKNEGYFRGPAMALASLVDVPVVVVGGFRSAEKIDNLINDTKIKYVALSRPLVREPHLVERWQNGDLNPSLCLSCNSCYRTPGHQCIFNLRKSDI